MGVGDLERSSTYHVERRVWVHVICNNLERMVMEIFGALAMVAIVVIWLVIPKAENRPLFHKSGKLYNDGDNT